VEVLEEACKNRYLATQGNAGHRQETAINKIIVVMKVAGSNPVRAAKFFPWDNERLPLAALLFSVS
jgi:hypothetical protein